MVTFGNRLVGDSQSCFITFEAGPTHDGVTSAKRLATLAADAGADAIKFQILDPDRLVADRSVMFEYEVLADRATGRTEVVAEPLYDLLTRRALEKNEWRDVKKHCDSLGLAFFATVGFEDEVVLLEEINCDSIKIASADINHFPLIRRAAKTGKCIQLDTGSASLGEVELAVDVVRSTGNPNIIIHQCPSGYPARLESINLRMISTLKQMFGYPVAYSDHTPGWEMDIAAVALGANLVEKTITEDRMTRSIEHIFSLEPADMREFIQKIRDLETALGTTRRVLHDEERKKRQKVRRSLHLLEPVTAGMALHQARVEFRRPGFGIGPDVYGSLLNLRFRQPLQRGHLLSLADLEG
jgi:N,N'-diacetyllegionaminate synthase